MLMIAGEFDGVIESTYLYVGDILGLFDITVGLAVTH